MRRCVCHFLSLVTKQLTAHQWAAAKRLGTPGLERAIIGWTHRWLNNNRSGSILLGLALGCILINVFDERIEGTLSRFAGVRKDQEVWLMLQVKEKGLRKI